MRYLALLCLVALPAQAQVYKCVDAAGRTTFSETACVEPGSRSEKMNIQVKGVGSLATPYQIKHDQARRYPASSVPPWIEAQRLQESTAKPLRPAAAPQLEIDTREVPYRMTDDPMDRRLKQIQNKIDDPRAQDAATDACRNGRPNRGVVKVRGKNIWPGMRGYDVRRLLGSPDSVNSFLVGQEQWSYREPHGGAILVYIKGQCVASIQ